MLVIVGVALDLLAGWLGSSFPLLVSAAVTVLFDLFV